MDRETGIFYTGKPKDIPDEQLIPFAIGEPIIIKDHKFIVCDVKNNRLVLRSERQKPSLKEKRLRGQSWEMT